jgi:hypothetical protein
MPTTRSPRSTDGAAEVIEFSGPDALASFTTAVSLHAHTNHSREVMAIIPSYLDRIPVVAPLARLEMRAYERRHGRPVNFSKGWWTPPVAPEDVLDSESDQITRVLGLVPIVSITDHDSIAACLALQRTRASVPVPISFEWTVPFGHGFFHLGVHNLAPARARDLAARLGGYTRHPGSTPLAGLLAELNGDPRTLVVLNHPLWDLAGVGETEHRASLRKFVAQHGDDLHAVELNGYRSWRENSGVIELAKTFDLPLVSGGDRHGSAPNSLLNLTTARSFGQFALEIRIRRRSVMLVMPDYRRSLIARKLAVAGDATRHYPAYPPGQRSWTDRVSYESEGVVRPLSDHWPDGGPLWVRSAMRAFEMSTRVPLLPLASLLAWLAGASESVR